MSAIPETGGNSWVSDGERGRVKLALDTLKAWASSTKPSPKKRVSSPISGRVAPSDTPSC